MDESLRAVKHYGNVVTIQSRSTHDLSEMQARSSSLHCVFMLLPLLRNQQRERQGNILKKIAELVDAGKLKPLIDARHFSFDQVGEAQALQESGKAMGKISISH